LQIENLINKQIPIKEKSDLEPDKYQQIVEFSTYHNYSIRWIWLF